VTTPTVPLSAADLRRWIDHRPSRPQAHLPLACPHSRFTAISCSHLFGIGANTPSSRSRPGLVALPVKDPSNSPAHHGAAALRQQLVATPLPSMFRDFRDHNEVFSDMFCRFPTSEAFPRPAGGTRFRRIVSGTYSPLSAFSAMSILLPKTIKSPAASVRRPQLKLLERACGDSQI